MIELKLDLPKGLENQLDYLEIISKQPKSFFIQEALKEHLEDLADIREALEALEEGKTYTTEELSQELGLE